MSYARTSLNPTPLTRPPEICCHACAQPAETEDEAGKREALAEALSEFCCVVRRGQPQRHDEQQLLTACGKLSMQHLLPIYNVRGSPAQRDERPACMHARVQSLPPRRCMLSWQGLMVH